VSFILPAPTPSTGAPSSSEPTPTDPSPTKVAYTSACLFQMMLCIVPFVVT
jgi:hypothetical protein